MFWPKTNKDEIGLFWPVWKNAILGTLKTFVVFCKKSFFSFWKIIKPYCKSYFDQKQRKKLKIFAFFDQKHGITPLEKCDFWDFEKFSFYSRKKFFFFFYTKLVSNISSPFWLKPNIEKIGLFWPKAWVAPFGKMWFLRL